MTSDLAATQSLLIVSVLIVLMVVGGAAAVAYVLVKRAVRERVESERLAAMGVASARILHQVKNPVATILMQGDLLSGDQVPQGDVDRRESAREITAAAGRVAALLHELSAYASGQARQIHPLPTELAPLLEDTVRAALAAHPSSEPADLDLDGKLSVLADAHLLRQAFDNVVSNALEAMAGKERLRVSAIRRGSDAVVSVVDRGPGIPADQIRRVLEPFVTSKRTGMGLGIPVARDIIEAHGGKFDLRSRVGEGTTVTLVIPLAEGG